MQRDRRPALARPQPSLLIQPGQATRVRMVKGSAGVQRPNWKGVVRQARRRAVQRSAGPARVAGPRDRCPAVARGGGGVDRTACAGARRIDAPCPASHTCMQKKRYEANRGHRLTLPRAGSLRVAGRLALVTIRTRAVALPAWHVPRRTLYVPAQLRTFAGCASRHGGTRIGWEMNHSIIIRCHEHHRVRTDGCGFTKITIDRCRMGWGDYYS